MDEATSALDEANENKAPEAKAGWSLDSLRGSSIKLGTMQRRLAWPLRKDDTHTSRSVSNCRCYAQSRLELGWPAGAIGWAGRRASRSRRERQIYG